MWCGRAPVVAWPRLAVVKCPGLLGSYERWSSAEGRVASGLKGCHRPRRWGRCTRRKAALLAARARYCSQQPHLTSSERKVRRRRWSAMKITSGHVDGAVSVKLVKREVDDGAGLVISIASRRFRPKRGVANVALPQRCSRGCPYAIRKLIRLLTWGELSRLTTGSSPLAYQSAS